MITKIFTNVIDKRNSRGKIFQKESILSIILLGKISGKSTTKASWRLGLSLGKKALQKLGFKKKYPAYQTFLNILQKIDCVSLEATIANFCSNKDKDQFCNLINIDGKSLRGSGSRKSDMLHIVSIYDPCSNIVLASGEAIKEGEMKVACNLISKHKIEGKIITADALFGNQNFCDFVDKTGNSYVLNIKNNSKSMKELVEYCFKQKLNQVRSYKEKLIKNHGRIEQREIEVMDMPLKQKDGYSSINQIAIVRRYRYDLTKQTKPATSKAILITNLDKSEASAERLLEINRTHWQIENNLHRMRDLHFREDNQNMRNHTIAKIHVVMSNFTIFLSAKFCKAMKDAFDFFYQLLIKKPIKLFKML